MKLRPTEWNQPSFQLLERVKDSFFSMHIRNQMFDREIPKPKASVSLRRAKFPVNCILNAIYPSGSDG